MTLCYVTNVTFITQRITICPHTTPAYEIYGPWVTKIGAKLGHIVAFVCTLALVCTQNTELCAHTATHAM